MRRRWLIGLSLLLVFLLLNPRPLAQMAYRAVRETAGWLPIRLDQRWKQLEGERFRLFYQESDEPVASGVLLDLEEARSELAARSVSLAFPGRQVAFLYPSQAALAGALGQSGSQTLGAYHLGKLHLLSPLAWLPGVEPQAALIEYRSTGPVVHELVHLGLDYSVAGNTPLWFSEGLAQYWELELNGYLWHESGIDWQSEPFALDGIDSAFGSGREYVAYRQSLDIVQYLYGHYGYDQVNEIVLELTRGQGFYQALKSSIGVSVDQLEYAWRAALVR